MYTVDDMSALASILEDEEIYFAERVEGLLNSYHWKGKSIIFLDDNHFKNLMNYLKRNKYIDDETINHLNSVRQEKTSKALETINEDIEFVSKMNRTSDYFPTDISVSMYYGSNRALKNLMALKERYNK